MRTPNDNSPFPCKDCTERKMGCHSTCEAYIEASERNEKRKAYIKENKTRIINNGDFLGDYPYKRKRRK